MCPELFIYRRISFGRQDGKVRPFRISLGMGVGESKLGDREVSESISDSILQKGRVGHEEGNYSSN